MSDTQCAEQRQLAVAAHDLKRRTTPKGGGALGQFSARLPAWDAHIRFCLWARDPNGGGCVRRLPQYRWTTPEGKQRYAPVLTLGSTRIERTSLVAALPALQKLPKQGPAP
jgi:hypothetical protein